MDLASLLKHPPATLRLETDDPGQLRRDDPARKVMTDLRVAPAGTITPETLVDAALEAMKHAGVRFLFVVDADRRLLGSISAFDILGEKRMQLLHASAGAHRWHEMQVRDLMEPLHDWRVIDYDDVRTLTVGRVATLLREACRRHLVVIERGGDASPPTVRGLFSAARVARLLGEPVDVESRAATFADIERRIA